jgi:hypothetical protein
MVKVITSYNDLNLIAAVHIRYFGGEKHQKNKNMSRSFKYFVMKFAIQK